MCTYTVARLIKHVPPNTTSLKRVITFNSFLKSKTSWRYIYPKCWYLPNYAESKPTRLQSWCWVLRPAGDWFTPVYSWLSKFHITHNFKIYITGNGKTNLTDYMNYAVVGYLKVQLYIATHISSYLFSYPLIRWSVISAVVRP